MSLFRRTDVKKSDLEDLRSQISNLHTRLRALETDSLGIQAEQELIKSKFLDGRRSKIKKMESDIAGPSSIFFPNPE